MVVGMAAVDASRVTCIDAKKPDEAIARILLLSSSRVSIGLNCR
jgi:hypothetical protein